MPFALQLGGGCAHIPPVQTALQQSMPLWQAVPSGLHADDWHVPPLQSWLQQALLAEHDAPWAVHMGWSHVPLVHELLQQSPGW